MEKTTSPNWYPQDIITNPDTATGAKDKIETALINSGSNRKSGKWQCPNHFDRTPSLVIYTATGYQGVYLKCFTGCHQDDILTAIGLTPRDKYDEQWTVSTPARDAITALRTVPIKWAGRKGRNQSILYSSCLDRAWEANTLTIEYSRYQASLITPLSEGVAGRTFRELCTDQGLLICHGIKKRGMANRYELVTGVGNTAPITKYKTYTSLTGYIPNTVTIPYLVSLGIETKAWLRPTGLAVIGVMSYDEGKSVSAIARDAGVNPKTARNVLKTMLRSNGLAEDTPKGWKLTGDLAAFHPETDIMGRRAEVARKARIAHKIELSKQARQAKSRYDEHERQATT